MTESGLHGPAVSLCFLSRIIRSMSRMRRCAHTVYRIKPLEGVGIVMLFLGVLLIFLWTIFILVRLVLG